MEANDSLRLLRGGEQDHIGDVISAIESGESEALGSDEVLMQAYSAGDQLAFAELYHRQEQRLFGFLERRLPPGRKHFAADLFQKTWLQVHRSRQEFEPGRGFGAWFFTIALNVLRDFVGKASFRLDVGLEGDGQEQAHGNIPSDEDVEAGLLIRERLQLAEEFLSRLPVSQREILLMSEWDGLSAREIGGVVGLSENAARQALFRAKRRMKELLQAKEGGGKS